MAKQFLILILMVSTIFCAISYSLPHRRDAELINCENPQDPYVVLVNSSDGTILNCKQCYKCPPGSGFGIPCNGQNVSKDELGFECVSCVAGVNFSTGPTGDSIQCQPCQTKICKNGMKIEGKCEPNGDKRICKNCEYKNWYYNNTQKICQPCFCQNMTSEIKQICSRFGFNYDVKCNPRVTRTTTDTTVVYERSSEETKYTVIIIPSVLACFAVFILALYFCCVAKRIKNLRLNHQSLSVCSKDWFCRIFFFKDATRSRPPSYTSTTAEDRNSPHGCASRAVYYFRQNSCPVTQHEKCNVNQGPEVVQLLQPQLTECKSLKNLKFSEMNAEVCRKICQALKQNIDTGMGFPTLAGYMGFTANDVKSFQENGDPCVNMFECWSSLNKKENTVLKLKELVVKLKRDDILEMIKSELLERRLQCGCLVCGVAPC